MRLPFLELSGSCYEQGQVHGESLKDLIEKKHRSIFQAVSKGSKIIQS